MPTTNLAAMKIFVSLLHPWMGRMGRNAAMQRVKMERTRKRQKETENRPLDLKAKLQIMYDHSEAKHERDTGLRLHRNGDVLQQYLDLMPAVQEHRQRKIFTEASKN